MTIRYKAGNPRGIPSGYSSPDIPADISVPGCGLTDVDRALFNFFDKELKLTVRNEKSGETKKAPVIFATGERWALFKKERPFRDNNQTIILPLVAIRRIGLEQDIASDITGRGINQQTGELVIKRRLSPRDRSYQNLIAKLGLPNQRNVSRSHPSGSIDADRPINEHAQDRTVQDGGLLSPVNDKNIWEIITIPSPQFYKATYEVTFWTSYAVHMNQMIQQMMTSYLMQGGANFRIETTQGYWFVASIVDNTYKPEDNSEDYGEEERLIRYSFQIKVPAYLIAGENISGTPAATRRYVSAPLVSFVVGSDELELVNNAIPDQKTNDTDLADDPTDPRFVLNDPNSNFPQEKTQKTESSYSSKVVLNPFSRKNETRYLKVVTTNPSTGETVYRDIDGLSFKIVEE
jgi:hypothetical protein